MKNFQMKYCLLLIPSVILLLMIFSSLSFSDNSFKKGFPAPNFSIKNVEGETFNLGDYKEKQKLIILYFCNNENENSVCGLEELVEYFEGHIIEEKYQVIMINTHKQITEEEIPTIKEFWLEKGITFNILLDEKNEVSTLYNIEVIPTTILLDNHLIVKKVYQDLLSKQQSLMFRYLNYFLKAEKKKSSKKEKKDDDGCNGGVCPPPPGY